MDQRIQDIATLLEIGMRNKLAEAGNAAIVLAQDLVHLMPGGGSTRPDILTRQEVQAAIETCGTLGRRSVIPAIRLHRQRTGMGIRDSKEIVEAELVRLGHGEMVTQGNHTMFRFKGEKS